MAENSLVTAVVTAVLTSLLTLAGTYALQSRQEARAQASQFLDAAQNTVQETVAILDDGYNALDKLINATHETGWKEFSQGPWREYMAFERRWHQRMIVQHFKLERYFGKDMADTLIDLDDVPVGPTHTGNDKEDPAVRRYNLQKLAADTEYTVRSMTVTQDIIDEDIKAGKPDGLMEMIFAVNSDRDTASRQLKEYDAGSIRLLKALDGRLTELGAIKVTVVNTNKKD